VFRTNQGLYEPLVMFFGLTNLPATFQSMMNMLFKDEIDLEMVVIYMDNILIFTKTMEEHTEMINRVLKKLEENKLFLKPKKCLFHKSKVEYLGLIISHNTVKMDPLKVQAISEWPIPQQKHNIQQFLGFVNFYQHFIEGFAKIAKPLLELMGKAKWN
jgi:hypothetical protein